ncbi:MAG TPA: hypothetical protein VIV60_08995, partial [Polyangiaceae bacterium]
GAIAVDNTTACGDLTTCTSGSDGPAWTHPPEPACAPCTASSVKMAGDNCNLCTGISSANDYGKWACSSNLCPACTPGATTSDGSVKCNNCTCNAAGSWECKTVKC